MSSSKFLTVYMAKSGHFINIGFLESDGYFMWVKMGDKVLCL